jgi:hypothetical protein
MTPSIITSGFMAVEMSPFNPNIFAVDEFSAAFVAEKPVLTSSRGYAGNDHDIE